MININELKGIIVARGLTQKEVALHLGLTPKTFYERMSKGIFNNIEISLMIDLLQIEKPMSIFFAEKVS